MRLTLVLTSKKPNLAFCGVRSGNCKNPSTEFFKSFHSAFVNIQEKNYVKLFLLLYYKRNIMVKRQFEKETIFCLRRKHYEELHIEMNVIPSLTLLILVK